MYHGGLEARAFRSVLSPTDSGQFSIMSDPDKAWVNPLATSAPLEQLAPMGNKRTYSDYFRTLVRFITNPSIPVASAALAIFLLISSAVCTASVSEVFYHDTLNDFAQASLNSVVTRATIEITNTLRSMEHSLDLFVYGTRISSQLIPSEEEKELIQLGLTTPLGPSLANISTGSFPFSLGARLANSSLGISTWRGRLGLQMAAAKMSSMSYFSNFDIVFTDGSYLTMTTSPSSSFQSAITTEPVLYDGILLSEGNTTGQYYYVRRSPLVDGSRLAFRSSTIIPSNLADRRTESWYKRVINLPTVSLKPLQLWSKLYFNATSGSSWIDLIARLDTDSGHIGKIRLTYNLDLFGWFPDTYREIIPMSSAEIFLISHDDEVIYGAPEFNDNLKRSLHTAIVDADYELTEAEKNINCILEPGADGSSQLKTCRHTVSSYGNAILQQARKVSKPNFKDGDFSSYTSAKVLASGKSSFTAPSYHFFKCDGKKYIVSSASVQSGTFMNPRWVAMVIVPESEVTGVLSSVRLVVILVTIGITVALGLLFTVGARFIFRPLTRVAKHMSEFAYLNDSLPSDFISMKAVRRLSRWTEVRIIQEAYWAMYDELCTIKAYIPEHIREEIKTKHAPEALASPKEEATTTKAEPSNSTELMPLRGSRPFVRDKTMASLSVGISSGTGDLSDGESKESSIGRFDTPFRVMVTDHNHSSEDPAPIYFSDSCLIDRDITVVHLNIIRFHNYARKRHPTIISSDFAEFIAFISTEARRFGGVLESFFSDKVWVSFNATSKCVSHQVAACYFAFHVTTMTNKTSSLYRAAMPTSLPTDGGRMKMPVVDKRFAICLYGLTCGIATGRAFVGPLGNNSIKRHTIISNAIPEAVALERQGMRFSGCNVVVSGDMLPHIQGYCQYMLLDASFLPGSRGRKKFVAVVMGPMLSSTADEAVTRRWVFHHPGTGRLRYQVDIPPIIPTDPKMSLLSKEPTTTQFAVPKTNYYEKINASLVAVLENRYEDANRHAEEAQTEVSGPHPAGSNDDQTETEAEFQERKAMVSFMVQLVQTFAFNRVDGRAYTSALGESYMPIKRLLTLAPKADTNRETEMVYMISD